jgi:hypothetical protein
MLSAMSTMPSEFPHDPLRAKHEAAAETLSRRRKAASETSQKIAEERNAFFDKLAFLNAGALTFSVTLLGHPDRQSLFTLCGLYAAWGFLLIALAACLIRNFCHQGYRFSEIVAKRMESEILFIDADKDILSTFPAVYADSPEPFDKERELKVNKLNRDKWQRELDNFKPKVERHWRTVVVTEWLAGICMLAGFLLLITFAIFSTIPTKKDDRSKHPVAAVLFLREKIDRA